MLKSMFVDTMYHTNNSTVKN